MEHNVALFISDDDHGDRDRFMESFLHQPIPETYLPSPLIVSRQPIHEWSACEPSTVERSRGRWATKDIRIKNFPRFTNSMWRAKDRWETFLMTYPDDICEITGVSLLRRLKQIWYRRLCGWLYGSAVTSLQLCKRFQVRHYIQSLGLRA